MRAPLGLVSFLALSCAAQPPPEPTAGTRPVAAELAAVAPSTTPVAPTGVTTASPPEPDHEAGWSADRPVDPATLSLQTLFVTTAQSAVCPTRAQAASRSCGNSVEDTTKGIVARQGETVVGVGDAPLDGIWKALRYQKAGVMPGWIVAEDVAATPDLAFSSSWDARADVASAQDATSFSREQIRKAKKGALLKWPRSRVIREGTFDDQVVVYIGVGAEIVAAAQLPHPREDDAFIRNHDCLIAGCAALAYQCDARYCDEVSVLARVTGRSVAVAGGTEASSKGPTVPLLAVVALADRFGLFEGP